MFTAILKKRSAFGIRASKFEGLDAMALQAQMAAGTTSASALTRYCLQRINRVDHNGPTLRSVIEVNPDALSHARALDAERAAGKVRGPMHGLAVLLKDLSLIHI